MQKTDTLVATQLDVSDPDYARDLRFLERKGIRVLLLPPGLERPTAKAYMVIADELLQQHAIYSALERIIGPGCVGPHLVVRWASEKPSINPTYAAERGFSPSEIDAALKPWIKQTRVGARRLVEEAAQQLAEAQALRDQAAAEATITMHPVNEGA